MTKSFEAQLKNWVKKVKGREDAFIRHFAQNIANKIINRTPVDTGFARASWFALLNTFDGKHPNQPVSGQSIDKNISQGQISVALDQAKMGDTIVIANNAAYILRLENGHSKQAPRGMVKTTLLEAPLIAKQAIVKANRGKA